MRTYYLQYDEEASINYLYLFLLHKIAEVDKTTRLYNTVIYNNLEELTNRLNEEYNTINTENKKPVISKSTLSRVLNSDKCGKYFTYDKATKVITLQNNFTKRHTNGTAKFITLTDKEINFLLIQNNDLLTKYYLFIKYYCGFSGRNETDFTAEQFLEASNYSTKAGNYKSFLCAFNSLLVKEGFISISKFRYNGRERNKYSLI